MDTRSVFRVETLDWGSMSIIALHGELDVSAQPILTAELDRVLAKRPVVVAMDLRGLDFMDSTGVHVLISTGLHCQGQGQRFFVIRGGGHIDGVLTACGVEGCLEMVSGPDQLPDGEIAVGLAR
jgi:anti-anti-sigma factor